MDIGKLAVQAHAQVSVAAKHIKSYHPLHVKGLLLVTLVILWQALCRISASSHLARVSDRHLTCCKIHRSHGKARRETFARGLENKHPSFDSLMEGHSTGIGFLMQVLVVVR
jgi:hypothetical protein